MIRRMGSLHPTTEPTPTPTPDGGSSEDAPPYVIGILLRRAHVRAARAFSAALWPTGIEGRHFGVLAALARHAPLNQRELVDRVGSDKASMVRIVDDLEAAGLATRAPDPHDRRVHAVSITTRGREVFTDAEHTAKQVATDLLSHLPPDDRDHLTHLLRAFAAPPDDALTR